MILWKNMDTLASWQALEAAEKVNLKAAMTGENGAERVKNYSVPMGEGLAFNYGARPSSIIIGEKLTPRRSGRTAGSLREQGHVSGLRLEPEQLRPGRRPAG